MGLFSRKPKQKLKVTTLESENSKSNKLLNFSVPFLNVLPGANLSKPYVNNNYNGNGFEYFGSDNLYPNLLEQAYYLSPIHNKCIDFSVNSICGGGFNLINKDTLSGPQRLAFETFTKINNLNMFIRNLVLNYRIHDYFYVEVDISEDIPKISVLDGGRVRINSNKTIATISDNWLMRRNQRQLPIYKHGMSNKHFVYMFQNMKIGMSTYPLPFYNSVMNDIENDQEISFYRLQAIKNGIFPGTVLALPYELNEDETQDLTDMLNSKKGSKFVNSWFVMNAEGKENLPEVTQLQIANNMDALFDGTEKSINKRIISVHNIGQSLVGESTAGQLGQNQQLLYEWSLYNTNVNGSIKGLIEQELNNLFDIIITGYKIELLTPNTEEILTNLITKMGNVKENTLNEK